MGNNFSTLVAGKRGKRGKRGKLSSRRAEHIVPAAQVLQGARGVHFNDSPATVAGRDVNNVNNVVNNTYYNTPGNAATKDADDELLAKVLKSLGQLNFRSIFNENVAKRTPETGREVIDSDWFKEWLMDLLGGIVWGTGMPGAGKTVLACIVIEHLQKLVKESESKDICLLFAFCRYTERLVVIDILLALLRQLLERHPQVLPYVKPMYERHKRENTRPSEAEVVDLLRQIATSGLFKKTFYILDGLDEAASDIQVDLLEILSSLPVHFFITSRPLDTLKDIVPNARFLTIIASDPDIALLIDQKIHRMPALRRLLINSATLKAEVVSMISSKSSGMFLLAALHLDMLKGCASESDVRKALDGLPQGLDGMYDKTMERIKALPGPQADLAKRVLIWVTYSQRPLTPNELVLAVSVCPETFRFDDKLEPADMDSILSLCCGLVQLEVTTSWRNGTFEKCNVVRFVHYSAAEYMVENLEQHYPDDPHALIAATCISFLRHYGFHDVSPLDSHDDEAIWDRFASLRQERTSMATYPYKYWGFHVTQSRLIPPSALAFLDDCRQYPSFRNIHELPWDVYDQNGQGLERLNSIHVAAAYGISECFERLESEGWTTTARIKAYNSRGSAGSTPLILAARAGSKDVVAFLMGVEGVDFSLTGRLGETALYAAVVNRHAGVVKVILSRRGVDVNRDRATTTWPRDTPLTRASRSGQPHTVQLLLEAEGIDVNAVDADRKTALMLAAQEGHHDIVKILLQAKGVDVCGAVDGALDRGQTDIIKTILEGTGAMLDEEGPFNSLMRAASSGKSEAVRTVLNHGKFDINSKDDDGRTALAYSLRNPYRSTGAAEALLQIPGINVNSVDNSGTTILMLALCHQDAPSLIETISRLAHTSDINVKDAEGRTALMHAVAASRGSREVLKMLVAVEGIDYNCVDANGQTPLMTAAKSGYVGVVELLLELEGVNINSTDTQGRTALAHAISYSRADTFDALLAADSISISADYTTSEGLTYLSLAAQSGIAARIQSVLQLAEFDVNARDIYGRTALTYAVKSRSYDAVEALLEIEGVDIHCVDEQGTTLVMCAARSGEVEMVSRFLGLGLGANINAKDKNRQTALAHAVLSGSSDVVRALLGVEGIDYNCVDSRSRTPLMMAAEGLSTGIVDELLELEEIKIDSRDDEGLTAMAYAVSNHQGSSIFETLLHVDSISADYTTSEGLTFLMLAADSGNARIVRSVLQLAQFDLNARDIHGRTALAYAIKSGSNHAVKALLEVEGIDVHCVDEWGTTCLMYASSFG
ncbi:ankyrin [Coprinopsis marcescibilis]|uniref:Ankyrin n=1 Tax=Coprinopsis marcescibilis TaxID=230819 RepID=A0A5C3KEU5_COPMA|nr:ankyrin [Coprinopsis marcescibilis]